MIHRPIKIYIPLLLDKYAANLRVMKAHLNQGPYRKKIRKTIASIATSHPWGPADVPNQLVAQLNQQLLDSNQIPNLEYGFSFSYSHPVKLTDIHYQTAFKELVVSEYNSALNVEDVSGNYLCVNFMWSRQNYLFFLEQLMKQAGYPTNATVYEESFPLSYHNNEFAHGQQALAELRISL